MILLTKKGEVMGEPELGMDLEEMLFDFNIDEYKLRQTFYAQLQKYVSEQDKYKIDFDISTGTDGVSTVVYLYINIDNITYFGIQI